MKKAVFGVVLAVVVAISLGGCGSAEAQIRELPARWEYKLVRHMLGQAESQSNALGKEGWEMVSCSVDLNQSGGDRQNIVLFFKRKLP